jgi:hypothetical protein
MDSQSKLPLQESHPCSASLDHFTKKEKDAPESPLPLLFPVVKMFPLLGTTSKAHLEKQVRLFTLCGSQKEWRRLQTPSLATSQIVTTVWQD